MSTVTLVLDAVERGEPHAAEELLPLVYEELRTLAAHNMTAEPPGNTLQATALVHEAWLRLLGPEGEQRSWNSRGHFFAAAAEAMRRILVDRARRRQARKHGAGIVRVDPSQMDVAAPCPDDTLLAIDAGLEELEADHPDCAQLVKLRFFAGLRMPEAAAALGISERSAHRTWAFARAWLYHRVRTQLES